MRPSCDFMDNNLHDDFDHGDDMSKMMWDRFEDRCDLSAPHHRALSCGGLQLLLPPAFASAVFTFTFSAVSTFTAARDKTALVSEFVSIISLTCYNCTIALGDTHCQPPLVHQHRSTDSHELG